MSHSNNEFEVIFGTIEVFICHNIIFFVQQVYNYILLQITDNHSDAQKVYFELIVFEFCCVYLSNCCLAEFERTKNSQSHYYYFRHSNLISTVKCVN